MNRLPIPGTNSYVYDGSIVILSAYKDTRWIVHYGIYALEDTTYDGWYVCSIPDNVIMSLSSEDLTDCVIIYTPSGNPNIEPPDPEIIINIDTARLKVTERFEVEGDTRLDGYISVDSNPIHNVGEPEADSDVASKQYVDNKYAELLAMIQAMQDDDGR